MALQVSAFYWLLMFTASTLLTGKEVVYENTDNSLTELPSDIPLNVTILILQQQDLDSIPARAFSQYKALEELEITFCKVTTIADDAFDGCPIENFVISYNKITSVRQLYCLDSIKQTLEKLNLSYNPIYPSMDPNWNHVLGGLGALNLLKLRQLAGSGMTTCPDLSNVATTLTDLMIDDNKFGASLTAGCFQGMVNLEVFKLTTSQLENFPDLSFLPQNNKLKKLDLEGNLIAGISSDDLANLMSLNDLDVSDNNLPSFPNVSGSSLQRLDLRGNPLVCDFNMAWMKQPLSNSLQLKLDVAPCAAPAHLVGVAWDDINLEDLKAEASPESDGQDILFDGSNSTCKLTDTDVRAVRRHVPVAMAGTKVSVHVVGDELHCSERHLQFFVSAQPATNCDKLLTRCAVVMEVSTLCVFECSCSMGGCLSGMLRQRSGDTPSQICEILYT